MTGRRPGPTGVAAAVPARGAQPQSWRGCLPSPRVVGSKYFPELTREEVSEGVSCRSVLLESVADLSQNLWASCKNSLENVQLNSSCSILLSLKL